MALYSPIYERCRHLSIDNAADHLDPMEQKCALALHNKMPVWNPFAWTKEGYVEAAEKWVARADREASRTSHPDAYIALAVTGRALATSSTNTSANNG